MTLKKSWAAGATAALLLSGCTDLALPIPLPAFLDAPDPSGEAQILGGQLAVQAPEGYCIDRPSSDLRDGFILMLPCALLLEQGDLPATIGLITLQVGAPDTAIVAGAERKLVDLLESDVGLGILSTSGGGKTINVLETAIGDKTVYVRFADDGEKPIEDAQNMLWRAFLDIDGRLATVTTRGFGDGGESAGALEALMKQALRSFVAANATPPVEVNDET